MDLKNSDTSLQGIENISAIDSMKSPKAKYIRRPLENQKELNISKVQSDDNDYSQINKTSFKRSFSKLQKHYRLENKK